MVVGRPNELNVGLNLDSPESNPTSSESNSTSSGPTETPTSSDPSEDDIRLRAGDTTIYLALRDAFSKVNDKPPPSSVNVTRNDLDEGKCAPNILIFARGTTETGNFGKGVGVPLIKEVDAALGGKVIFQGVNQ